MVTAGGGGGFSVVVDWGVGSVEPVVPSVVGGAWYIKIIITDVKKYTKGKILLTYMILYRYTTFAYSHFTVCHYRLTTKLFASSSKLIQPIGRQSDMVVSITAILFILFFALDAVVSVWVINAV